MKAALWLLAEAYLLTGRLDQARGLFAEASAAAVTMSNFDNTVICEARLAWAEAADRLGTGLATIEERRMDDFVFTIPAFAGAARPRRGNAQLADENVEHRSSFIAHPAGSLPHGPVSHD